MQKDTLYLSIDCETGGIGLDLSLLSIALILYNNKYEILDSIHLKTFPNDEIYKVTASGLQVNGIDLVVHHKSAISYKAAGNEIYKFIYNYSNMGSDKLIPVGKNLYGDLYHLWDKCIKRTTWEQYVSYRTIDINALYMILQKLGKIPSSVSGSLASLAEYYQIDKYGLHDAYYDAKMVIFVLKAMEEELL